MADDGSPPKSKEESLSSSTIGVQRPKTISVNVDLSADRWVVVSYQDEKGDLFHGVLLKASEAGATGPSASREAIANVSPLQSPESWKKPKEESDAAAWISASGVQSTLINGAARSPPFSEWDPQKFSAVNLRRTCSNGTARKEDEFTLANSKPALGIRRLENRSVRLRPTASQRSTVLCAKCQEQRVYLPGSRRAVANGGIDRSRNGPFPLFLEKATAHRSTLPASSKRRSSDGLDSFTFSPLTNCQTSAKKFKTRNGASVAAEADQATSAALPSASKVVSSSVVDSSLKRSSSSDAGTAQVEKKNALPKIPKLKISFGNNEEKTTTVISLSPASVVKSEATVDGTSGVGKKLNGFDQTRPNAIAYSSGDTFDEREGVLLPGGLRVGDIVWAKMQSSPYWPAKIYSASGNAACVTWCGSRQYGFVEFRAMEAFKESFHKRYNAKRNNGGYQKAVAEAIVKCSGNDGDAGVDPSDTDSYYYRHIISPLCWKYLTGSRNAAAQSRRADRDRRRSRGRNGSTVNSRRGQLLKLEKQHQHTVDGIDSESLTSVSSMNSPRSTSTTPNIDWQPRVVIRISDMEIAEKEGKGLQVGNIWKNSVDSSCGGKSAVEDDSSPTQSVKFYLGNGSVSPLPVQRSEDDDDDDDDDFKKLEIDETAQLDDDDDGEHDPPSSSGTSVTNSGSPADGGLTCRLTPTVSTNEKAAKHQGAAGESHGQQPAGVRTRLGEGQDDFESALTELQEMNELCAGTSVLAQC